MKIDTVPLPAAAGRAIPQDDKVEIRLVTADELRVGGRVVGAEASKKRGTDWKRSAVIRFTIRVRKPGCTFKLG